MKTIIQRKVCLLGDFGVGKTSLVRRFVEGRFDEKYLSTIGVQISRRVVTLDHEEKINLVIWDVSGGEEFNGKEISYLQGASGALLVCDLTRKTTLVSLPKYVKAMRAIAPSAKFVLLANKSDLVSQFEMGADEIASMASQIDCPWFITSAKTGEQVEEAFTKLAQALIPPQRRN
ncbi:MAG: Rab family GTPase [Anaerolineales bacterium]